MTLTRPQLRPRPRRAAEIIAAARVLLETEGRDALTMRRLGEALGIQAPSLYKHLPGKRAVEIALIEIGLAEIGEALHRALADPQAPGTDVAGRVPEAPGTGVAGRVPEAPGTGVAGRVPEAPSRAGVVGHLLAAYRAESLARPNLYRLATTGPLPRADLTPGLEDWAGEPWFIAAGDPFLAQAMWSFAHGTVILELDERYPEGSELDRTWRSGAEAFALAAAGIADAAEAPRSPGSGRRPKVGGPEEDA